jgi:hypothetical protein
MNNNSPTDKAQDGSKYFDKFFKAEHEAWLENCEQLHQTYIKITDDCEVHEQMHCWTPVSANYGGLAGYTIELSYQGYWRLRYAMDDYILDDSGDARERTYSRKLSDGQVVQRQRKDKKKASFFLHHLAVLCNGGDLINPARPKVPYTVSHLCGNALCINWEHIRIEPHAINLSRVACCREICTHKHKCVRPAAVIQAKISKLEAEFGEFL